MLDQQRTIYLDSLRRLESVLAGQSDFDKADNSQTWSGRGRQPKWVAEGLDNGRSLEEFRI